MTAAPPHLPEPEAARLAAERGFALAGMQAFLAVPGALYKLRRITPAGDSSRLRNNAREVFVYAVDAQSFTQWLDRLANEPPA